MSSTFHASCLCGEIRWEVDGPLVAPAGELLATLFMPHCHCSRCRKAHGAPYATFVTVPEGRFRITHGRERTVRPETPGAFRAFCGGCGSVVPDGVPWNGFVGVPAGNFDEDIGVAPTCRLFVGSRAPWDEITDGVPRFDTFPEGIEATPMETRPARAADTDGTRGSCLCGAVTYVIEAPPIRARTCHCSRCRKASSTGHMSWLATTFEGLRFTCGEALVVTYKVPEARFFSHAFCRACGSSMPRKDAGRGLSLVPMGSLDDDPGIRPSCHIYVGSRASWDPITDGLPQYEESAPA
jgi:hypothetical protein